MYEGRRLIMTSDEQQIELDCIVIRCVNGIIYLKSNKIMLDRLPEGTKVQCVIYNNDNQIHLDATILEMNYVSLSIRNISITKEVQMRDEVRVNTDFKIRVMEVFIGSRRIQLDKAILMHAINISVGGILLYTELDIPMDMAFHLGIKLGDDNTLIQAIATPMRKEQSWNTKGKGFSYGCKLELLNPSHTNIIRKFVYQAQLADKKKAKDQD